MGAFQKAIIRQGFGTVYRASATVLPASRDQLTRVNPPDITLSSGTGSNAVDLEYVGQLVHAASVATDYDLRGVLLDAFGGVLSFAKVKGIFIYAYPSNTNSVIIKPAATNGALLGFSSTSQWTIPPGGSFQATHPVSGWAITATTADLINIANSGAGSSVTFDLHIIGTSV